MSHSQIHVPYSVRVCGPLWHCGHTGAAMSFFSYLLLCQHSLEVTSNRNIQVILCCNFWDEKLGWEKNRSHKSICLTYLLCDYLEQLVKLFENLTYLAGRDQDSLWARQKQTLIHGFDIRGELYFKWSDVRLFWHLYGEIQLSLIFKERKKSSEQENLLGKL